MSCGFYATVAMAPLAAKRGYGQKVTGQILGSRAFGRIEKLAEGVYALISTPFDAKGGAGDRRTHSNGGLIIGRDEVLAIDSYRTSEGANFLRDACIELTGRAPTLVVNTHFHFDHLGGTLGLLVGKTVPEVIMTETTRKLAFESYGKVEDLKGEAFSQSLITKWGGRFTDASRIIENEEETEQIDLGGRMVSLMPMKGHTGSDLVIRDDPSGVTFGGDLIWDGIFPNFMSSTPSLWKAAVKRITGGERHLLVPGHGSVCQNDSEEMTVLSILMDEIEAHARGAFEKGDSSDEAAASFKVSESAGDWSYFRQGFHEIAMEAWYRELKG